MAFLYKMSPVGQAFHESDSFVKMALGPYGSGKSTFCAVDLLSYACAQAPAPDGTRYSRWGVIRSTYPELVSTTRKSLVEVFPDNCGSITSVGAPLHGLYIFPLPDGSKVHMELDLVAIKRATPDELIKLQSMNWTGCWINEATGIESGVFNMVLSRIGRYPSQQLGGVSWGGVIMDFNMPPPGSWVDVMMKDLPDGYTLFRQPAAATQSQDEKDRNVYTVNPEAENLRNLGSREEGDPENFADEDEYEAYLQMRGMRYYRRQIEARLNSGREDEVQNLFCMMDVPILDGKLVHTNFSSKRHVALDPITPVPFQNVILGMDQSGLHPACVAMQFQFGRWCVQDEIYADGEGFSDFLNAMLIPMLRQKYADCPVIMVIDPSDRRDDVYGITTQARLEEVGLAAFKAPSNNPKTRIQAVDEMLNLNTGGLLVSPSCEKTIRAFTVDYKYRRLRASGTMGAAYVPTPDKNEASHIMDAIQYAVLHIRQGREDDSEKVRELTQRLSSQRRILTRVV